MKYRFLRFPGGKPKALTFSYDDGCRQDKETARILAQYGVKGTFNINSGYMGASDWYLTADEIREHIISRGFEIAVHGDVHIAPGMVRAIDGIKDCLNCRFKLEEEFGGIIRGMAYPNSGITRMHNGADYETIKKYLKDLDVVYSRSLCNDNNRFDLPSDWHNWIPTMHHDNVNSLKWAQEFVDLKLEEGFTAYRFPRLMYIWGHSYEFENRNNWEHLCELLDILSNRDDIWYATNIEIYEYVEAYERLVSSADGNVIHNPTAKTIWFTVDGEHYKLAPGETLNVVTKVINE